MALACVERAVRGDTADVFIGWDLVEKIRQHWSVTDAVGRHLDGPYLQCLKLLGQRLSARDFDRQVAEIQVRAAILNGFTALGIPKTVAAA